MKENNPSLRSTIMRGIIVVIKTKMARAKYKDIDDNQLAIQSQDDLACFEELMLRYEGRLISYALRISSFSHAEAQEIVQEVFIKTWQNLQGFDASLQFSSWVYRITYNLVISEWRKKKSRGTDRQVSLDDSAMEVMAEELDFHGMLDAEIHAQEIQKILENLKPEFRDVLVLRFMEDLSYDKIADVMQKPPGTIATLISRSKKQFKQLYEKYNARK